MRHFFEILGVVAASVLMTFIGNDLYAFAPRLQRILLKIAAWLSVDQTFDQYWADLNEFPSAEGIRTLWALDCLRGQLLSMPRQVFKIVQAVRRIRATSIHLNDTIAEVVAIFDASPKAIRDKFVKRNSGNIQTIAALHGNYGSLISESEKIGFLTKTFGLHAEIVRTRKELGVFLDRVDPKLP